MKLSAAAVLGLVLAVFPGCSQLVSRSNAGIRCLEEAPAPLGAVAAGAKYAGWALSAPLVAALAPVAALAWATPWVDLPGAVDIASSPAIGLGYALEGAVGFPLRAAFLWKGGPAGPAALPAPEQLVRDPPWMPWGLVVAHLPGSPRPRPPVALADEDAGYYAVRPELLEALRRELAAALGSAEPARGPIRL